MTPFCFPVSNTYCSTEWPHTKDVILICSLRCMLPFCFPVSDTYCSAEWLYSKDVILICSLGDMIPFCFSVSNTYRSSEWPRFVNLILLSSTGNMSCFPPAVLCHNIIVKNQTYTCDLVNCVLIFLCFLNGLSWIRHEEIASKYFWSVVNKSNGDTEMLIFDYNIFDLIVFAVGCVVSRTVSELFPWTPPPLFYFFTCDLVSCVCKW